MNVKRLERIALTHPAGFTVERSGLVTPRTGYAVSRGPSLDIPEACALLNSRLGPQYVGGWLDPATQVFMLERSYIFGALEDALAMARAWNQKAIYCFAEREVIYV
jgi:hypothetical protein